MDLNKKLRISDKNYGLVVFVGGIIQLIFGFGFDLIPMTIFIVSIAAFVLTLKYDRNEIFRKRMGFIGLGILIVAVILYFWFGWTGFLGYFWLPLHVSMLI